MDKGRWARMSPELDELLDLVTTARDGRLADLRRTDGTLADALRDMLEDLRVVDREAFLQAPPFLEPADRSGEPVGAYVLEREIGQGGMGSVWLARRADGRFEGRVAIKFLESALLARGGRERFAREGQILARLSHPNIARLLDAGVTGDRRPYLVLEYIEGQPIDAYCESRSLGVGARVRLFLDVLAAVSHAHQRLILHRDLKPANILVTADGEVKLLDFGIAKLIDGIDGSVGATELTQAGGRPFTPSYAAPEQVLGTEVSTQTDVYALGVLLFMLLGGGHPTAPPDASASAQDRLRSVLECDARRLSDAVAASRSPAAARELRGDLDNIVARALKKAPAERYADASALADDLRRHLAHEPVLARRDTAAYVLAKFVRRHRIGVSAAALLVLTLAAGVASSLWQAREARRQHLQAESLIEFMLGDLRKKLQPVGRLDALDAVGEKALAYYDTQQTRSLDADSLGRRARALHLIGEIAQLRGHLDEASTVFERAAQSTAALMARTPGDVQRVYDHAQSVYWVGYAAWRRGQAGEAQASFLAYRALSEQLVRMEPAKLEWQVETAYAASNLGVVDLDSQRPAQALERFTQARRVFDAAARARPEFVYDLAGTLGWIAKAHEALGEFAPAIQAQQAKVEALGRLPDAATNRRVQRLLANAAYELGRLHLSHGDVQAAATSAAGAVERFAQLSAQDPANLDWLSQLAAARLAAAEVHLVLGDPASARREADQAAVEVARLLATDASQARWHIGFQGALLALQLRLAPSAATLQPQAEAYLRAVAAFEASGHRLDAEQLRTVAGLELQWAEALAHSSQSAEALAHSSQSAQAQIHWRAAAARLAAPAAHGDLAAMASLARAQLGLGDVAGAARLADRLDASAYRHPAFADLRQRLSRMAGAATALREK
jgi:eukaryotic-like serine/threonine-protein kinase